MMDWFWKFYERYPTATAKLIAHLLVILVLAVGLFAIGMRLNLLSAFAPVAAAPTGGGDVAECEIVAKAGTIDIYYCEPTLGPDFLINSVGFMLAED